MEKRLREIFNDPDYVAELTQLREMYTKSKDSDNEEEIATESNELAKKKESASDASELVMDKLSIDLEQKKESASLDVSELSIDKLSNSSSNADASVRPKIFSSKGASSENEHQSSGSSSSETLHPSSGSSSASASSETLHPSSGSSSASASSETMHPSSVSSSANASSENNPSSASSSDQRPPTSCCVEHEGNPEIFPFVNQFKNAKRNIDVLLKVIIENSEGCNESETQGASAASDPDYSYLDNPINLSTLGTFFGDRLSYMKKFLQFLSVTKSCFDAARNVDEQPRPNLELVNVNEAVGWNPQRRVWNMSYDNIKRLMNSTRCIILCCEENLPIDMNLFIEFMNSAHGIFEDLYPDSDEAEGV